MTRWSGHIAHNLKICLLALYPANQCCNVLLQCFVAMEILQLFYCSALKHCNVLAITLDAGLWPIKWDAEGSWRPERQRSHPWMLLLAALLLHVLSQFLGLQHTRLQQQLQEKHFFYCPFEGHSSGMNEGNRFRINPFSCSCSRIRMFFFNAFLFSSPTSTNGSCWFDI